jgi:hydroxymethylpyrimidine/phosphomethylpyrimidine kinase
MAQGRLWVGTGGDLSLPKSSYLQLVCWLCFDRPKGNNQRAGYDLFLSVAAYRSPIAKQTKGFGRAGGLRYSQLMGVPPVILSVAGYDPSSGAGITADVKTAAAHGCYAATCITAITVQTTQGVFRVQPLEAALVAETLTVLAEDLDIRAVRLGMLGSDEVVAAVADFLEAARLPNVVLDPVIRSSSGATLLDAAGLEILRRRLLPLCDVLTPNVHEAAMLAGATPVADRSSWDSALPQLRRLASGLHNLGAEAVVITGGHLDPANDYLSLENGKHVEVIPGERLESRNTHGTGCAYATAMACRLALGDDLARAAKAAKEYVRRGIQSGYAIGKGTGPINHFG